MDQIEVMNEGPFLRRSVSLKSIALKGVDDHIMKINQILLEEVLRIKVNILQRRNRGPLKSILVTSANHGEGTSTLAIHLAFAFAVGGSARVLLVDANIRRPSLHTRFGLERETGFVELINGKIDLGASIKQLPSSNIKVMTAGQTIDDTPIAAFHAISQEAKHFIERDFDWVLYDAAPVNGYPDTLMETKLADGVILVIQAEKTRLVAVRTAKESLESVEANILGGALNGRKYFIPEFIYRRL